MNTSLFLVLIGLFSPSARADPNEAETSDIPAVASPSDALIEALAAQAQALDSLNATVQTLQSQLIQQKAHTDDLSEQLAKTQLKLIKPDGLTFELEGYYRTRSYVFNHLFASQTDANGDYRDARYMAHRLKVRPVISYKGLAKFTTELDFFGSPQFGQADAVWGDNASRAVTSVFAADPSFTSPDGTEGVAAPTVTRAWLEMTVPLGVIKVGRQPSNWGMGLLANDGNGFDDDFGENHYGSTYDRAIFATKPISVFNGLTGRKDKGIPLYVAIGVDRLVEDPLNQYYGYKCTSGIFEGEPGFDPRCDKTGTLGPDGLTDVTHGYVDDTRLPSQRKDDWWANQNDDVMETVWVVIYKGEDVKYLGSTGDLTAGTYIVNRRQRETNSNLYIIDGYFSAKQRALYAEFEGLTIQGPTSAIALAGSSTPDAQNNPLYKQANIWSAVGRFGVERANYKVGFEGGFASGDENIADENFSGRPLHPDYNVGLLLYEQVLARVSANAWGPDAQALWSRGGVTNSKYIFPTAHWFPLDNWEVLGGFLLAYPHKPDGAVIQCKPGEGCAQANATQSALGWEADLGIKIAWHEHLRFSLEAGYAKTTDRLAMSGAGLNPEGRFFTVQNRVAFEF